MSTWLQSGRAERRELRQNRSVRSEMSTWLQSQDWDLFTTYTFTEHFNYKSAKRAIERHYKRMVRTFKQKYPFFYIIEPHSHYEVSGTHIHGLVGGVREVKYSGKRMKHDWRKHKGHGAFQFDKYIEDKGVDYYLTKYLVKSDYDESYWDIFNLNDSVI